MSVVRTLVGAVVMIGTFLLASPSSAWGEFGHRITAEVALENVEPATRAKIERLLRYSDRLGTPDCALDTLADAAVWPDCVRRDYWRWGYTAAWHYRTAPICEEYDATRNCPGGSCVTGQIERNKLILSDESLPPNVRLEALAFLVHFIGDVHMPLHSGDREDRGGNDRRADYGIVPGLNLHWVWDGPLAERAITDTNDLVVRRYSETERAELGAGDAAEWGRESWQISRELVYPNAFGIEDVCANEPGEATVLSQEAIAAAAPVARRRIRQAGVRMAQVLDEAFAPGALPIPERR